MRSCTLGRAGRSAARAACILTMACAWVPAPAARPGQGVVGRTVYRSPDRALVAVVVSLQQRHSYGDRPSRVEIRRAGGRLLASRDHSASPDQGYTVEKAAWTADSRFFVYLVSNSGGHSPWHHPIFFYSRRHNRFYSLDRALGALARGNGDGAITGGLALRRPSTLVTKGRYYCASRKGLRTSTEAGDESGEKVLAIDLRWLERHVGRGALQPESASRRRAQR